MKKLDFCALHIFFMILFVVGNITYADPALQDTVIRYYSISPTAFVPRSHSYQYSRYHDRMWAENAGATFYAPLYLPDSAQVIEFKAWVYDSDPDYDMSVGLVRTEFAGGMSTMSRIYSAGDVGMQELIDSTIEYNLIDNSTYKYSVDVTMPATGTANRLYAMRIKYNVVLCSTQIKETSERIEGVRDAAIYPTLFSHETVIRYEVLKRDKVSINIYDEAGRLIRTLVDDTMPQGYYIARWDGKDSEGRNVSNGSYFCVVKTNGSNSTKVVHIK